MASTSTSTSSSSAPYPASASSSLSGVAVVMVSAEEEAAAVAKLIKIVPNREPELSAAIKKHEAFLGKLREARTRCAECDQPLLSFDEAVFLPCLHVICAETCLDKMDSSTPDEQEHDRSKKPRLMPPTRRLNFTCPKCGPKVEVDRGTVTKWEALGAAIFFEESLLTCTQCVRSTHALYWCAECDDSMCQICKDAHYMRKRSVKHLVTFLDPSSASACSKEAHEVVFCPKHGLESTVYCINCNIPLCQDLGCKVAHTAHDLKNTKEVIAEFRIKAKAMKEKMREFLDQTNPTQVVESLETEIARESDPNTIYEVMAPFRAEFQRIIKFVADCEDQILQRLKVSSLNRVIMLKIRKEAVSSVEAQVTSYLKKVGDSGGLSNLEIGRSLDLLELRLRTMDDGMQNWHKGQLQSGGNADAGPLEIAAYLRPLQGISEGVKDFVDAFVVGREPPLLGRQRKTAEPQPQPQPQPGPESDLAKMDAKVEQVSAKVEPDDDAQQMAPLPPPPPPRALGRVREPKTPKPGPGSKVRNGKP